MDQYGFERSSKPRNALVELLKSTKVHPDANYLYNELKKDFPTISLGTVYRNLSELVEKGIIIELSANRDFKNYDGDVSTHSHFICESCGKITDIFESSKLPKELDGVVVTRVSTVYYGLCEDCMNKDKQN